MKKSFRMTFKPAVLIAAAAVAVMLAAGLILSAINLARWAPAENSGYFIDVISLILTIVILILLILVVLNSRYILDDAKLRLMFGVFSVSVPIKDMLMIRTDEKRTLYLLYYNVYVKKTAETKTTFITLSTKGAAELAAEITKLSDKIIYDVFTEDSEGEA